MEETAYISPRQFAVLTATSFLALGIFEFPRNMVSSAGSDALYSFLLASAGAFLALWLHFAMARFFPGLKFARISEIALGPAKWLMLIYAVGLHVALAVVALANFSLVLQTFFLDRTPIWAITIASLVAITSVGSTGTVGVARTLEFFFLPALIFSVAMAGLMLPRMRSSYTLLPSAHLALLPILSGTYHGIYVFIGMEAVNLLLPWVKPSQQAEAERLAYWAIATACAFFLVGFLITLGNTGPGLMHHLFWPPVKVMRVISMNSFLINKLGLVVVLIWGIFVIGYVTVREWALTELVRSCLGLKSPESYRLICYSVSLVILLGTWAFPNISRLEPFLEYVLVPWGLAYLFGAPLLLMGGGWIHRRLRGGPGRTGVESS